MVHMNDLFASIVCALAVGCTGQPTTGAAKETPTSSIDTGLTSPQHPHAVSVEWTALGTTPAGEFSMVSSSGHGPYRIYIGTDKSGLFISHEASVEFTRIGAWDGPSPHVMAPITELPWDNETIILTSNYDLWISNDLGRNFRIVEPFSNIPSGVMSVAALDEKILVAEASGEIWSTTDQFESVQFISKAPVISTRKDWENDIPAVALRIFNDQTWLLSQRGGPVFRTDDAGLTWQTVVTANTDYDSLTIQGSGAAMASDDGILRSHDRGFSWYTIPNSPTDCRSLSWVSSHMAAACNDILYLSDNDGEDWSEHDLSDTPWSVSISPILPSRILVGAQDTVFISNDGGETFTTHNQGLVNNDIAHMAADPIDADRILVGTQCLRGFFRSNDRGEVWDSVGEDGHYVMGIEFAPSDPSVVYACDTGLIFRSDDRGETMQSMPALPSDVIHPHGISVHPEDPMHVLIGTSNQAEGSQSFTPRVLRSTDGGETWTIIGAGLPDGPIAFIALTHDPNNANTVLVGAGPGGMFHDQSDDEGQGLWISRDGGESFAQAEDIGTGSHVYAIEYNPHTPGQILATTNMGIFRSNDDGNTWSIVLEENTNRQIAWHPTYAQVVFVSRGLTTQVSLDSGDTWSSLGAHTDTPHGPPPPPDGGADAHISGLDLSADGAALFLSAGVGGAQRGDLTWDMTHPEGTPETY
jgi:photosystem II stability/assembly factor-like uncharacterized protein